MLMRISTLVDHQQLLVMGVLKEYLESSTIHGLAFISSPKSIIRLFWLCVVVAGFSVSGYLISKSIRNWNESPVKTTIDTLPINDISLPKISVCPPMNKLTTLNYDLKRAEKMTIAKETRERLFDHGIGLLQEYYFKQLLEDLAIVGKEERYLSWYQGSEKISFPYQDYEDDEDGSRKRRIEIQSVKLSDSIIIEQSERAKETIIHITHDAPVGRSNISVSVTVGKNVEGTIYMNNDKEEHLRNTTYSQAVCNGYEKLCEKYPKFVKMKTFINEFETESTQEPLLNITWFYEVWQNAIPKAKSFTSILTERTYTNSITHQLQR